MQFAGRDISTFWHTKATKFDVSYYTDFERQEIVSNGLLRARVEVPTLRIIKVELVTKAPSKEELDTRLREISTWLYDSGEAKLFSDRDGSRYYKARCTAIDIPKFNGTTCRYTVAFTCSDYRPYNSITNNPIGTFQEDLSNFRFKGAHCLNSFGAIFVQKEFIGPAVKRNAYEISGASGTIRYDDGPAMLEERTLSGTLYFIGNIFNPIAPEFAMHKYHLIMDWLINAKRAEFIFDSDITKTYQAELVKASKLSFDDWANGKIEVEFLMQPYCENNTSTNWYFNGGVGDTASGEWTLRAEYLQGEETRWEVEPATSGTIYGDGSWDCGYPTPLTMRIQNLSPNGGDITRLDIGYYDDNNKLKMFSLGEDILIPIPSDGHTYELVIDSANFEVYKQDRDDPSIRENMMKYITQGDFPIIYPNGTKALLMSFGVVQSQTLYPSTGIYISTNFKPRYI